MAKVSLNKITPIKKVDDIAINIGDEQITVKQYLPIDEKALFSERVLSNAMDPNTNFASEARMSVYFALELIRIYTNINLTDKMLEEATKTYDLLLINHVLDKVIEAIPAEEYNELYDKVYEDRDHLETYLHSIVGVLRTVQNDYSAAEIDVDKITEQLKDPESFQLLKNILDKVG